MGPTALVVGGGVAGLQAVKALLSAGFEVICLEENECVGGVWARNYSGYGLQIPLSIYQFPDFPNPVPDGKKLPTGQEVQAYVQAYVKHFKLDRVIRTHSRVISLAQTTPLPAPCKHRAGSAASTLPLSASWEVVYEDTRTNQQHMLHPDFVVMSTGLFSTPFVPFYEGLDQFKGIWLHSKDALDLSFAKGKDVVVVGAGKTGWELVSKIGVASVARTVTVLYRRSHWTLPRSLPGGRDIASLLFSRHTTAMMPPYYTATTGDRVKHKLLKPIKSLFWRRLSKEVLSSVMKHQLPPPEGTLQKDLFHGGQIYDDDWLSFMNESHVKARQGGIRRVMPDGIEMFDGEIIKADVLLFCTGYHTDYMCFSQDIRTQFGIQTDGLYLYRNIIPPNVPGLAFIGGEVSTFNNILTSGLQAQWLKRVLMGAMKLPSRPAMVEDMEALRTWRRARMPAARNRGAVYMLYAQCYHDQLVADMGERTHRKAKLQPFAERNAPYLPSDYADIFKCHMPEIRDTRDVNEGDAPSPNSDPGSTATPSVGAADTQKTGAEQGQGRTGSLSQSLHPVQQVQALSTSSPVSGQGAT